MTGEQFDLGIGPAYERLQRLARRAEGLPADARAIVEELLEAFSVSVEQLQGASEALHQQKQALLATREEVEAQRRRYRNLLEFAPDGYLVTDPAALVVDANQAAVDLLHIPKPTLLGKPLVVYVVPGQWDRFHTYL
ncbi:MAG: PAS domain-containing protein, partial [Anaerolineae bacterium]